VAIEERQFESEFGFKSPGFTVDKLGNITATSINAAGAGGGGGSAAGDYTVTEVNGQFRLTSDSVIVGSGDNPTISVQRGQEYTFTLNLSGAPITFNILDATGLVRYNTGIQHQADNGTISDGAAAQGYTTGKLVFTIPSDAPDTLYYGNSTGSVKGTITVNNAVAVDATFANLTATGTTSLQTTTATELTINGNGTVTGDLAVQGKLTGDSLSVNGLGVAEFNAGTNIVLRAGNKIDFIINDVILGTLDSAGSNVAVVNTTLDNTTIGATTASTGAFTSGTVASQPTTANGISNKKYVDNTSTALAIALGV
jgi:hypothetical protein|tara:strand:+ start:5436 stop:6371 length:936 start_codon:yes stop_codon:yes gene_type:complete